MVGEEGMDENKDTLVISGHAGQVLPMFLSVAAMVTAQICFRYHHSGNKYLWSVYLCTRYLHICISLSDSS